MKPRHILAFGGLVLCGLLTVIISRPDPGSPKPSVNVAKMVIPQSSELPRAAVIPGPTELESRAPDPGPSVSPVQPVAQKPQDLSRQTAPPAPPRKGKDPIKDPLARAALAWVGFSEEAEAYWVEAINDPNLSAQERQDLIEDLNEDGISDPKHPTLADLPLILNRLDIIEALAPGAMDEVNSDAFMEAYKDLVNLANVAVGAGEPVK